MTAPDVIDSNHTDFINCIRIQIPQSVLSISYIGYFFIGGAGGIFGLVLNDVGLYGVNVARVPADLDRGGGHLGRYQTAGWFR